MHWYPLYLTQDPQKTAFCCLQSVLAHHRYRHDWRWMLKDIGEHAWGLDGLLHLLTLYGIDYTAFSSIEEALAHRCFPIIANLGDHFVLVMRSGTKAVYLMDPLRGYRKMSLSSWKEKAIWQCLSIGFIGRYPYHHQSLWPLCLRQPRFLISFFLYLIGTMGYYLVLFHFHLTQTIWLDLGRGVENAAFLWVTAQGLFELMTQWQERWPSIRPYPIKQIIRQNLSFVAQLLWGLWLIESLVRAGRSALMAMLYGLLLAGLSHYLWHRWQPADRHCLESSSFWNYLGGLGLMLSIHLGLVIGYFGWTSSWIETQALLYIGLTGLGWHWISIGFHLACTQLADWQYWLETKKKEAPLESLEEIRFYQATKLISMSVSGGFSSDHYLLPLMMLGKGMPSPEWQVYINGHRADTYSMSDYHCIIRYFDHFCLDESESLRDYLGEAGVKLAWQYQLLKEELLINLQLPFLSFEAKELAGFIHHYLADGKLMICVHCLDHLQADSLEKVIRLIQEQNERWVILVNPQIKLVNPSFEYAIMGHEEGGS